ncbi:hypothetical protein Goshw_018519, partial [Gossypium schwendimanii]|nr:hypothetical protein [Gossypium schwendimanii]
ADDHVLEGFTHNLSKSLDTEIHGYLQDARFLHVSCMLGGCKLDHTLINALDESVVTGSTVVLGKENLCETFLGKVNRGHSNARQISKFGIHKVATTPSRLQRMQMIELGISYVNRSLPAPAAVMGVVVTTISMFPSERLLYIPIGDKVELWVELCGTNEAARRYPATIRSTLESRECVPLEFLAIRSMWEVKMPLIVYVAVEMHEIIPTDATV